MKIGFIDKYLDEWHANHLPEWLRDATNVEEIYCYEQMPSPHEGGISGKEWAQQHSAILCDSIEEVIEKSDFLIVLAPNYPESHEELCDLPLRSGKPTYVDKTFAPDKEMARKLIELAKDGVFDELNIDIKYIEEFKNTIYEESQGQICLDISKLYE